MVNGRKIASARHQRKKFSASGGASPPPPRAERATTEFPAQKAIAITRNA